MRKIFFVMVLLASVMANAQVWIGGSIGVDVVKPDYKGAKPTTTFTIAPELGVSCSDKFDVALSWNASGLSYDGETVNSIIVEPYGRWTFANSEKVSFFIEAGFGVGWTEFAGGEVLDDSQFEYYIGLRPGVKFEMSDKVGLVAKLGFIGYENVQDTYEAFGFNVNNNSLSLGMYYSF